jgi:electron transport complex protein RnfB
VTDRASLADAIDRVLPQTQCTRCGYPDCRAYAEAIARGEAGINQCPPGGLQGIERLARITGTEPVALDPARGVEGPRMLARIDEASCIGCTLCIDACPVDCILGAPKLMHTVVEPQCTGCELCIPVCPVDCIALVDASPGKHGWDAWSEPQAQAARARYAFHLARNERDRREREAGESGRAAIAAALARARARRAPAGGGT